ncbi:MAG: response regulator [Deltaproteobacteria bacterium]|nr:MAG: response regulator [Deltaproteobacteria bacterium]
MLLDAWHGRVLPELPEDQVLQTRARVIAAFVLVELLATGGFALLSPVLMGGWYAPFGVLGVCTSLLAASALRRGAFDTAGHLTLIGAAGAAYSGGLFTGGIHNPAFAWIFFVPLFAGLLLDATGATVWALITGIVAMGGLVAHIRGWLPARVYGPPSPFQPMLDVLGMTLVATAVVRLYQQTTAAAQRRLTVALSELQEEVTVRRRAEVEARQARASQEDFLASVSHEIRTPMNGIIGVSELLARSNLGARELAHVEALAKSAETLRRLLTDLLDLSKLRAGGFSFRSEAVDLHTLIRTQTQLLRGARDTLTVDSRVGDGVAQWVDGDEVRLSQMLGNLLANAGRFATSRVLLVVSVDGKGVEFSVEDDGPGIPEEERGRVVLAFQQVRDTEDGTGLGLSLVAGFAEALGGQLGFGESDELGGAAVRLWLPLNRCEPMAEFSAPTDEFEGSPRVLLVDDDPVNRLVIRGLLETLNVLVDEAESGEQALAKLRESACDLVLMDLQMPGLSGIETARFAIAEGFTAPIVCLTASSAARVEEDVFAAGMVGVVTKPVIRGSLADTLRRHLGAAE